MSFTPNEKEGVIRALRLHQDALDKMEASLGRIQQDINFLKHREKMRCNTERDQKHTLH